MSRLILVTIVSVPATGEGLRGRDSRRNPARNTAMAQDRQQMDEEVAALRKARIDIDSKLDAALENRTARTQDEGKTTRMV